MLPGFWYDSEYCSYSFDIVSSSGEGLNDSSVQRVIDDINAHEYKVIHIMHHRRRYHGLNDNELTSLNKLIAEIPSVKHLELSLDITAAQAAQLANSLCKDQFEIFSLGFHDRANQNQDEFQNFIETVSSANIKKLEVSGANLTDELLEAIDFGKTAFDSIQFNLSENISGNGIKILINGLKETAVKSFSIHGVNSINADNIKAIDLSNSNLKGLSLDIDIESGAIEYLNLKNSNISLLSLHVDNFTIEDVQSLEKLLLNGNIKTLHLSTWLSGVDGDIFDGFDISNSNLEFLSLNRIDFTDDSKILQNLSKSNLKGLSISSSNLGDEHIKYFNFESSELEYFEIVHSDLSEKGFSYIEDAIRGTNLGEVIVEYDDYDPIVIRNSNLSLEKSSERELWCEENPVKLDFYDIFDNTNDDSVSNFISAFYCEETHIPMSPENMPRSVAYWEAYWRAQLDANVNGNAPSQLDDSLMMAFNVPTSDSFY